MSELAGNFHAVFVEVLQLQAHNPNPNSHPTNSNPNIVAQWCPQAGLGSYTMEVVPCGFHGSFPKVVDFRGMELG